MGDPSGGYFEIYTTVDGGDTWTRVPSSPNLTPLVPEEYGKSNAFTVLGNTIWTSTTFGRILKSTDKGLTWTTTQSPVPDFGGCSIADCGTDWDMAFSDENNGLIQTDDYQLFSTHDGGSTWETVNWSGVLRNFGIAAVPGLTGTYISVGEDLITSPERGSSFSIDSGVTWFNINDNPDLDHVDGGVIAMLNQDYGFASGFSTSPTQDGIFRWGGGPLLRTAILAATVFATDKSVMVSPNPTSGILNIKGKNISRIAVFDLLGKQMSETNDVESDAISYDLGFLTNGVYLVKITNDKGTSIVKIVKK